MGDTTDELVDLAHQVSPEPPGREMDMLLTAGERMSMALLAMAIHDNGFEARSYTGSQAGLITDSGPRPGTDHRRHPGPHPRALADGAVPIVAGFQGVSQTAKTSPPWGAADPTRPRLHRCRRPRRAGLRDLHRR